MRDLTPELERCDREIAACRAYDGPDKYGATWGEVDWMTEKRLLEKSRSCYAGKHAEEDPDWSSGLVTRAGFKGRQSGRKRYVETGTIGTCEESGGGEMEATMTYSDFLRSKAQDGSYAGFDPVWMPGFLFDFQQSLVDWSARKGKSAIFADCGLGKTPIQLVWAENVVRKTNKPVLILTPLAVAQQTMREAHKFDIEARRSNDGKVLPGINITNYEKLHLFDPADVAGVVCDESSAIKAFNGRRRAEVTEFLRTVPYRLLCTATAAPNDYIELGTSSEALGVMGQTDMLNRFFKNDQNTSDATHRMHGAVAKWRFKGHAEMPFWRWVCSWARAIRRPSDLGFSDDRFVLPPLIEREHIVETRTLAPGMLFALPATNMQEEREERRRTLAERCEMAAELVSDTKRPAVIWCHLNDEGDTLAKIIPDGRQVSGSDSDEAKEEAYEAFSNGQLRVLVIKPKIGAFGLNWQHCSHVVTFASHSYEQYYQAVRRCWRFGQANRVIVDLVATEGERGAKENMKRKSDAADKMFSLLVRHMNDSMKIDSSYRFEKKTEIPTWL